MHKIEQILRKRTLLTARPEESVAEVAAHMTAAGVGAAAILEGDQLVGIFSERDLMTRVIVAGRDPKSTVVRSVMTDHVITASLQDRRSECLEKMRVTGCRHLPILTDGHVIAMLSMRDLLSDEIEEQSHEIESLRAYLHQDPI